MQALRQGWQNAAPVVRPAAHVFVKSFFAARLDLAVAIGMDAVAPGGLGIALSRVVRLLVATRVARSQHAVEEAEEDGELREGQSGKDGAAGSSNRRKDSGDSNSSSSAKNRGSDQAGGAAARSAQRGRPLPKGLGGLPPLPLPRVPPGGLASCSVQPLGLPMMLVGQSAARAPLYAARGDRLIRGLAGLAASFLLCRAIRTPFTGRRARLPPRIVEFLFHSVVGPAAAASYLSTSAAGQAAGRGDAALCQQATPALQQLYSQLRGAGQAEAQRGGRPVVFAGRSKVEAIPRNDINACCLPGGIIFVHSGLLKAVQGRRDSLSFVLGHEVGHAIGRHSLEKTTSMYTSMFAVDALVGLAERLLKGLAAGEEDEEWVAGRLKTLDGALQSGLYLLQMRQSRKHEYEADQMALALGAGAGMDSAALHSGARDVLTKFMKMEAAGAGGAALPVPVGAPQTDSPLSTHPAAVNRLQRLTAAAARRA